MGRDNKAEIGHINLSRTFRCFQNDGNSQNSGLERKLNDLTNRLEQLSAQCGVPAVNIEALRIELHILDILPREIAEQHVILPIEILGDELKLAMASPEDAKVIDEIGFVSGKNVIPYVALRPQLIALIEKCYNSKESGDPVFVGTYYGKAAKVSTAPSARRTSTPPPSRVSMSPNVSQRNSAVDLALDIQIDTPLEDQLPPVAMIGVLDDEPDSELSVRKKILVVDDEDDIRLLISRVLSEKGYDVVTAGRGLEAVQMVQNEEPDMIILDAMLPEVHGFDICRKIKGSKKYGHIPVIMISAIYRGWRYAQDLKDSYGVDDFIEKPFKLAEFLEKVEKLLAQDSNRVSEAQEDLTKKTQDILSQSIKAYKMGNIENAIELLKKGLDIDPLAYRLHYNLALLLGKKALNYQAIRELESTLELEPNYFPAMKNLALLYQKAGFKFKAIETWERSLHYCPDDETRNSIKQHLMDIL